MQFGFRILRKCVRGLATFLLGAALLLCVPVSDALSYDPKVCPGLRQRDAAFRAAQLAAQELRERFQADYAKADYARATKDDESERVLFFFIAGAYSGTVLATAGATALQGLIWGVSLSALETGVEVASEENQPLLKAYDEILQWDWKSGVLSDLVLEGFQFAAERRFGEDAKNVIGPIVLVVEATRRIAKLREIEGSQEKYDKLLSELARTIGALDGQFSHLGEVRKDLQARLQRHDCSPSAQLGRVWRVCEREDTSTGETCWTWKRQPDNVLWIGKMPNGAISKVIVRISGPSVTGTRKDDEGPSAGLVATYTGTITKDGRIKDGKVEWCCDGHGTRRGVWTATIDWATAPDPEMGPMEPGTNRPGSDYRYVLFDEARPEQCQQECFHDERCRAWTFVQPGAQGGAPPEMANKAFCWLKDPAPAPYPDPVAVSGVKTR